MLKSFSSLYSIHVLLLLLLLFYLKRVFMSSYFLYICNTSCHSPFITAHDVAVRGFGSQTWHVKKKEQLRCHIKHNFTFYSFVLFKLIKEIERSVGLCMKKIKKLKFIHDCAIFGNRRQIRQSNCGKLCQTN